MKISFSEKLDTIEGSGKHKFIYRLSRALVDMGCTISDNPDIHVFIPGTKINKRAKKNILRLDGLWIDSQIDYHNKNNKILSAIKLANALIYQNEFCELAYRNFLKVKPKQSACILNGADPAEFKPRDVKDFFLANCKWRPHKRLRLILEAFLLARDMGLKSKLHVTGDPDYVIKDRDITYIGWVNNDQLVYLLSQAIASLHLSWIDWCPNAMVEAMVSGCPVIYTNSGGHSYIANGMGYVIEDKPWDFQPCDYYNPPELSKEKIAQAMLEAESKHEIVNAEHLHINKIAKQYMDFFIQVMS